MENRQSDWFATENVGFKVLPKYGQIIPSNWLNATKGETGRVSVVIIFYVSSTEVNYATKGEVYLLTIATTSPAICD